MGQESCECAFVYGFTWPECVLLSPLAYFVFPNNKLSKPKQQRKNFKKKVKATFRVQSAPVAKSIRQQTVAPVRNAKTKGGWIVAHRELINQSVAGATSFTVAQTVQLNPGLTSFAPWLAPQAQQYEQYAVRKLRFVYIPIAPTSTQGEIILSPEYDPSDAPPQSEVEASDTMDTVTDSCWQKIVCDLNIKAMMGLGPRKYVRAGPIRGDIKTFDVGAFNLCVNNQTGTSAVGKLWVEYEFEFFVPQNSAAPGPAPASAMSFFSVSPGGVTKAVPFTVTYGSATVDALGWGPGPVWTPPAGTYLMQAYYSVSDDGNEEMNGQGYMNKNAGNIAYAQVNGMGGATLGLQVPIVLSAIATFNGTTDTFSVGGVITGAAGGLAALDATLLVQVA